MTAFHSVKTDIGATILFGSGEEITVRIRRIAETGLLLSGLDLSARDSVAVYLESGERFEGMARPVARHVAALSFSAATKTDRVKAVMAREHARLSGAEDELPRGRDERGAARYDVDDHQTTLVRESGETLPCQILDVSLTGLGIVMAHCLTVGEIVSVGKVRAKIVRQTANGYGLQIIAAAPQTATDGNAASVETLMVATAA